MFGQPFKFKQASEPTDIIWENRHFTNWQIYMREAVGYGLVFILLIASFYFIYWLASYQIEVAKVFPTVDCDVISKTYGDQLEYYAFADYSYIHANPKEKSSGTLQCYCTEQYEEFGTSAYDMMYGPDQDTPMCMDYLKLMIKVVTYSESLKYVLTIFNYILRTVVIMVVTWIGYSTNTAQLERITTVTFLCQFFNTAFIMLLVNADLSEQPITLGFTSGTMGDFNSPFFKNIGNTLIGTMIFNAYYPLLEFLIYWGLRVLFRCLDRPCCSFDKNQTKKTSTQAYVEIYSGPVYYMHYKYSTVLNVCFVTMMYGFGLPLLFPVAVFSFVVLYFLEKSMLLWSYRMPPMYDERLSKSVLRKLRIAPLFYLAFAYWMASSKQLLSNEFLYPVDNADDT